MNRLRNLVIPLLTLAILAPTAQAQDAAKTAWEPLFNGNDLSGWTDARENASEWRVVRGILEGRGGGRGAPGVLLSERSDFVNFTLQLKLGFQKPGGGGIELRRSGDADSISAYWVSACVNPYGEAKERPIGHVGKLTQYRYGTSFPPPRDAQPVAAGLNRWHTLTITVNGNSVTTFVNGRKADEFTDSKQGFRSGAIAIVCRGDSVIQLKEVLIQALPD